MTTIQPDPILRRALLGNAVFSTLSGLIGLLFADSLGTVLGVPSLALSIVGVLLLLFAGHLLWLAPRVRDTA